MTFVLLFNVPAAWNTTGKEVYAFVMYFLCLGVGFVSSNLAYHTLLSVITSNSRMRVSLTVIRTACALVTGLGVNVITIPLVASFGGGQTGWSITALIYGGLALLTLLVVFFGTKERVRPARAADASSRRPAKQLIGLLLRNPYFFLGFAFFLCVYLLSGTASVGVFYASDVLGGPTLYSLLSLVSLAPLVIGIWFMPIVIARYGKRRPILFGIAITLVGAAITFIDPTNLPLLLTGTLVKSLGGVPAMAAMFALVADIVDYGEWKSGVRLDGMTYGAATAGQNFGAGLGATLVGWLLAAGNYQSGAGFRRVDGGLPLPRHARGRRPRAGRHHLLPRHRQAHAGHAPRAHRSTRRRNGIGAGMTERLLMDGWTVTDLDSGTRTDVSLPHDATIHRERSADAASGYHGAYFPGGRYLYSLALPRVGDGRHRLRFEGIGGAADVRVNGAALARVESRYRETVVDIDSALRPDGENVLEVEIADTSQPDSRWYTGSGLYRPVWWDVTGPARFAPDGVRITTQGTRDREAMLQVDVSCDDPTESVSVEVTARDAGGVVAFSSGNLGSHTLTIDDAHLWSAEDPHLYDVTVALQVDGVASDVRTIRYGIRTLTVDAEAGLRVNGQEVLLRGACIHHDSGVLGAATHRDFEFRRARILKETGYNAVRSSHNPLSRDMLAACDEVGLYVMDELTDVWFAPKTAHDRAPHFEESWPDDLRSMVMKDRNHACVIMYSIGNEVGESATDAGVDAAQRMTELARELDSTRPTTLAVNFLLNVLARRGRTVFKDDAASASKAKPSAATSTAANVIANKIGAITGLIARLPAADAASRDAFDAVDVAGYNYGWTRYRGDARRHADRVVVGSETMPGDIARIWPLVERLPNVIGDFMWTGWDYLGEAGLGDWAYGPDAVPLTKPYPQLTSGTGTIDILGHPGAMSLLARAVWGQLRAPAIAVRPLDKTGMKVQRSAWRSTDAVSSWAWRGADGVTAEIEVYSADDEVELVLNGRPIGRRKAGARHGYLARFATRYEPGELIAIGYRGGIETSRSGLRSASQPTLTLTAEHPVVDAAGGLAFVEIAIGDKAGTVEMLDDDDVTLSIDGPGTLAGFGSGASANPQSFTGTSHRTFRGRALAVVRASGDGRITVHATSLRHGERTIELSATSTDARRANV